MAACSPASASTLPAGISIIYWPEYRRIPSPSTHCPALCLHLTREIRKNVLNATDLNAREKIFNRYISCGGSDGGCDDRKCWSCGSVNIGPIVPGLRNAEGHTSPCPPGTRHRPPPAVFTSLLQMTKFHPTIPPTRRPAPPALHNNTMEFMTKSSPHSSGVCWSHPSPSHWISKYLNI